MMSAERGLRHEGLDEARGRLDLADKMQAAC